MAQHEVQLRVKTALEQAMAFLNIRLETLLILSHTVRVEVAVAGCNKAMVTTAAQAALTAALVAAVVQRVRKLHTAAQAALTAAAQVVTLHIIVTARTMQQTEAPQHFTALAAVVVLTLCVTMIHLVTGQALELVKVIRA